ncbi:MAG: TRAP transporter large permease [Burkholderiaceae bacterium]|jgi:C4-dicarboxylate transporter DctM subunit|nr:TRAP transporter large permease [Burkholderiaceae bacterium]MDH5207450.1 TRAP transporter large permease [Burkholderiaceae bacterium]
MSELQIGGLVLTVTLLVLFSGLPIAWGLTAVAVSFLLLFKGPSALANVPILMMDELSSFALLTIPLFVLLGAAIGSSAAGKDIYESLHRWLDRVPGGLVIANILACGVFSAICGSSPATAAAIGKAGVPEMIKRGVSPAMATGSICAGGTLGILIPPSITMILYGLVTETSIGRLFLAGVVPGVLLVLMFSGYAWFVALRAQRAAPPVDVPNYTLAQKMEGLGRVSPFIGIVVAIGYAMYGGLATPSEVAALSAVLALVLVVVIYRQWRLQDQWRIFRETVRESSMILMIIGAAAVFSYMLSLLYVTQSAAQWLVELNMNRWVLLFAINVFLLVAGCFLPPVAIILMVMPILTPVLEAADFDLIWFAVILTINMEVGLITPPVGLNLYVLKGVAPDVPLPTVLKGSLPFVLLMFLAMVLISLFPEIALWLPGKMMN